MIIEIILYIVLFFSVLIGGIAILKRDDKLLGAAAFVVSVPVFLIPTISLENPNTIKEPIEDVSYSITVTEPSTNEMLHIAEVTEPLTEPIVYEKETTELLTETIENSKPIYESNNEIPLSNSGSTNASIQDSNSFNNKDNNSSELLESLVSDENEEKNIKITFNANGGSVSHSSINVTLGDVYGSLPIAQKDYFTFSGWYTTLNGGTKITNSTRVTNSTNHTLYAHWEENNDTAAQLSYVAWEKGIATEIDMQNIVDYIIEYVEADDTILYNEKYLDGNNNTSYYYLGSEICFEFFDLESLCSTVKSSIYFRQQENHCGDYHIFYEEYNQYDYKYKYRVAVSTKYV